MTVKDNQIQAAILLAIFAALQGTLMRSFETRPKDLHLLKQCFKLVLMMTLLPTPNALRLADRTSPGFRGQFIVLSSCEVLFTLVLPWMLLLQDGNRSISLVPHLLIFQGQILAELVLFMAGRKEWVFGFTCVANAFRLQSILAGLHESVYPRSKALSIVALLLWLYSSFVFIPFVWYRKDNTSTRPKIL